MGIIKEIFGKVRIYQLRSRVDSRGLMSKKPEFTACPRKALSLEYTIKKKAAR